MEKQFPQAIRVSPVYLIDGKLCTKVRQPEGLQDPDAIRAEDLATGKVHFFKAVKLDEVKA